MTELEASERRLKRTKIVAVIVIAAVALITGLTLGYTIVTAVKEGVDPLEARVSALERAVADLQDASATR